MKLHTIIEGRDSLLVEEMFQNGTINEGVLDKIDTAVEVVFGAAGFIPVVGDVFGDLPMVAKNLIQGDYLGAAIYLISMEPSPFTDAVAKSLRTIQKLARHTGQEKRLNKMIGWLMKKTSSNQILGFFDKAQQTISHATEKTKSIKDKKAQESISVIDKTTKYINDNIDKMKSALEEFLGLIDKKAQTIEPVGGLDMPDEYVSDLIKEIKDTYYRLRESDLENKTNKALLYKKKLRKAADNKKEVKQAYEDIFGPIPEIE